MSSVKTTCTSIAEPHACQIQLGVRFLREGKGAGGGGFWGRGWGGGGQLNGEQDGTNGEIYNNGR